MTDGLTGLPTGYGYTDGLLTQVTPAGLASVEMTYAGRVTGSLG